MEKISALIAQRNPQEASPNEQGGQAHCLGLLSDYYVLTNAILSKQKGLKTWDMENVSLPISRKQRGSHPAKTEGIFSPDLLASFQSYSEYIHWVPREKENVFTLWDSTHWSFNNPISISNQL